MKSSGFGFGKASRVCFAPSNTRHSLPSTSTLISPIFLGKSCWQTVCKLIWLLWFHTPQYFWCELGWEGTFFTSFCFLDSVKKNPSSQSVYLSLNQNDLPTRHINRWAGCQNRILPVIYIFIYIWYQIKSNDVNCKKNIVESNDRVPGNWIKIHHLELYNLQFTS
jgi:hypothetical protein